MKEFIDSLARGAGGILKSRFGSVKTWETKEDRGDIVTEVDLESERYILERIKKEYPSHNILAEESGSMHKSKDTYTWFVDPLDGTRNYAMSIPFFCVSIGVAFAGELRHAAVYDPVHDEMFYAAKGEGAFVDGNRLSVSKEESLSDSLVAISWVNRHVKTEDYLRYVRNMSNHSSYFRRFGSAALMLAYVASCRVDAYLQGGLNPWDVAAGALLVSEAGGVITDIENHPIDLAGTRLEILAASPSIHQAMLTHVVNE